MGEYFSDKLQEAYEMVFHCWDPNTIKEGQALLIALAKEGNPDAAALVSRTYGGKEFFWPGAGIEESDEKAFSYLQEAIKGASPIGILLSLRMAGSITPFMERHLPISKEDAFLKVLEAAKKGDAFCQYIIGNVYFWRDYQRIGPAAIERLKNNKPTTLLGKLSRLFTNEQKKEEEKARQEALYWLEESLNNGFSMFPDNLRNLYLEGKKLDKARSVMTRAAKFGNPNAMYWCGIYAEKDDKDLIKATEWYEKAAAMNDQDGLEEAADMFFREKGIPINGPKAIGYYERAAAMGTPYCMIQSIYGEFFGLHDIPQDFGRAAYWAVKSIGSDHEDYLYPFLAYMYLHGLGLTQDNKAGVYYLQRGLEEYQRRAKENKFQYVPLMQEILFCALGYAYEKGLLTNHIDLEKAVMAYQEVNCQESKDRLQAFTQQNGIYYLQPGDSHTEAYQLPKESPSYYFNLYIEKDGLVPAHRTSLHTWDMVKNEFHKSGLIQLSTNRIQTLGGYFVALASVALGKIEDSSCPNQMVEITFYGAQEVSKEKGLALQKEYDFIPMIPIKDGQFFLLDHNYKKQMPLEEGFDLLKAFYEKQEYPNLENWTHNYRHIKKGPDKIILEVDNQAFTLSDYNENQKEILAALENLKDGIYQQVSLHLESYTTGVFFIRLGQKKKENFLVQIFLEEANGAWLYETEIDRIISLNYWLSNFIVAQEYPDFTNWTKKRLKAVKEKDL